MAKDKEYELRYKIEGLKRIIVRKIKRGRKQRIKSLIKQGDSLRPSPWDNYWNGVLA